MTAEERSGGALLQRAYAAIQELSARLESSRRQSDEPVAVIGLACRIPGAPDAAAFWELLRDGVDAVRPIPADRWDSAAFHHPDPAHRGTMCTREGGFLEALDRFDAAFFGIAPREAAEIDPQHRLLLEVAWEALEDAGQTLEHLKGSRTGVFVGISTCDYAGLIRSGGPEAIGPYFATGNALNAAAGRISFALGLRGPCLSLDTACSSSLAAVHLACLSLRFGESKLALAGGVNLILTPDSSIAMSRARALAPDGRCKTFHRGADGYGRGEGCGVVVLKRLSEARADGDPILGVIRGTALLQDGQSAGFTVPSATAQQQVIRAALEQAAVKPADVGYVETHGTGTSLGDPIEVRALGAVLAEGRSADRPVYLGAVKTNIGHLESAAGVAGLIKVVLALRHREIPPNLHQGELNPDIDLSAIHARIPRERTAWPAWEGRRLAGVSAFGLTGTIAHAIVEEAPAEPLAATESRGPWLLPISARAQAALPSLAAAWRDLLRAPGAPVVADLIHTACRRRTHHDQRAAVVGRDAGELAEALDALVTGKSHPGLSVSGKPAEAVDAGADEPMSDRTEPPAATGRLVSLANTWVAGGRVDWNGVAPAGRVVPLPAYPWQRERHWVESSPSRKRDRTGPPFPGERVFSPTVEGSLFRTTLGIAEAPFLSDHRIEGRVVVPGACHLSFLLSCASVDSSQAACVIENLRFPSALVLDDTESCELQAIFAKGGAFRVMAGKGRGGEEPVWTLHATGSLRSSGAFKSDPIALDDVRGRCEVHRAGDDFYEEMSRVGYHLGSSFRWIEEVWSREGEALGRMRAYEGNAADGYALFPGLMDSCFQLVAAASRAQGIGRLDPDSIYLPVGARTLRFHRSPVGPTFGHVTLQPGQGEELDAAVRLVDSAGAPLLEVAFLGKRVRKSVFLGGERKGSEVGLFRVEWTPAARPPPVLRAAGTWLLIPDRGETAAALAKALEERGERCVVADTAPPELESFRGIVHLAALDALGFARTDPAALARARSSMCGSVIALLKSLVESRSQHPRLWLVTAGAQSVESPAEPVSVAQAPLWGLARTITVEHPDLRASCVDLPCRVAAREVLALAEELLADDKEDQIVLRGDRRFVARLMRWREQPQRSRTVPAADLPFGLFIDTPGVLENLALRQVPRPAPGPGEVEIEVRAAGINFVDVLSALGARPDRVDGPVVLGGECSGVISAVGEGVAGLRVGDPVVAAGPDCFRRFVTVSAEFAAPKPPHIGFEQAATLPITFMTAHRAIHHLGRMRAGERILIHSASGGVGLAAVQLARRLGLEIFATAGSEEKRQFLRELGVQHVMDSRSLDFADEVMVATGGAGVDAVLSALTGEAMTRSLSVLAPHGRFLEIGKRDIYQDSSLGLWAFRRNGAYFAIDLIRMRSDRPRECAALLHEVVEMAARGEIQPLQHTVFPVSQAQEAFRLMAQARHIGKIVLSFADPEARVEVPDEGPVRPDAAYLIVGGLGGLGLTIARWLVEAGARHLALAGRGEPTSEARQAIAELEARGARVLVGRADVTRPQDLAALMAWIDKTLPPLRGVVHAAGVLDDALLTKIGPDRLAAVMQPKVEGAWNLHAATADRPLDFFVLFSSLVSILGAPGQGNYAAANAFLDALARARCTAGLPALAIDWGPWAEVGMASRLGDRGPLALRGIEGLKPSQGAEIFGRLLRTREPQVSVLSVNLRELFQHGPMLAQVPLLASLAAETISEPATAPFRKALQDVPASRRLALLEDHLREQTARVLGLPPSRVDPTRSLDTLGLDSLMALELRNRLEAALGLKVSPTLAFNYPTLAAMADHLGRRLGIAVTESQPQAGEADMARRIEELSDDEAAAILADRLGRMEDREPR